MNFCDLMFRLVHWGIVRDWKLKVEGCWRYLWKHEEHYFRRQFGSSSWIPHIPRLATGGTDPRTSQGVPLPDRRHHPVLPGGAHRGGRHRQARRGLRPHRGGFGQALGAEPAKVEACGHRSWRIYGCLDVWMFGWWLYWCFNDFNGSFHFNDGFKF